MFRRTRIVSVCVAVTASLVLPGLPATAVPPRAGATYTGQITDAPSTQDAVSFHVSKNGKWVRKLEVGPWPLTGACGSGGELPDQSAEPARIRKGEFTAHVVYSDDTGVMARATVTGTFLRKGKEKGEVSTHRISDSCDVSLPYRTHTE